LRFRAGAGVARRLLFLAPPAFGQRRGLLLRLFALARLGERRGLGALALGDQPRRLGFGFRASMRDAAQLDLGGLALAREVQRPLLVIRPRRRDFLGAAI